MNIAHLLTRSEETQPEAENELALTAEKEESEINKISQFSECFSTEEMSNELNSTEPEDDLCDYH